MEDEKCKGSHKVDGKTPTVTDIQYAGKACDCGRLIYYSEMCGCFEPHLELREKPNE